MATAVTLKESDGSEIYPVTDISLVNGGISAHDILPASSVAPITTDQIQDGAVTASKIDFSSFPVSSYVATLNSTYITSGSARWVKIGRLVILNIADWTITANIPSNSTTLALSDIPKAAEYSTYGHFVVTSSSRTLRLAFNADRTSMNFFWASGAAASELCAQIIYVSEN